MTQADLARARRIADAVYMRRLGLDLPADTDMDDVVEVDERDAGRRGFQQHALPRRKDTT